MNSQPSFGGTLTRSPSPISVRVLRTLGHGRAARAQLVDAVTDDGRTTRCVEKVFAPGLLTRIIYRLSFQSPFAYQSNRDAVLACYYRRRVAAAVLAGSDIEVSIASPLYVRFDPTDRAWVLAAEWIDGRGIKPAQPDMSRVRRWLWAGRQGSEPRGEPEKEPEEIEALVNTMRGLETLLADCGLVGSGWQVAPRAMVSTANLLRCNERYTIIDLESGIPAVLVRRYLIAGARRGTLPPFDDLDGNRLQSWIDRNERLLTFRIGPDALAALRHDSRMLIEHSRRWKDSELALFRRPWRLLSRRGWVAYQQECFRRWRQDGVVDAATADDLQQRPVHSRLIWYAGLLPLSLGRLASRLAGRSDYRQGLWRFLRCPRARADQWQQLIERRRSRWSVSGRVAASTRLTTLTFCLNLLLAVWTPRRLHRFLMDPEDRRQTMTRGALLLLSPRYQAWYGQNRIEKSIRRWQESQRISEQEADQLRLDLHGSEVCAYTRGFGMHLALKAFAPIIVPAKVGGLAAFFSTGTLWFLLPLLATPMLRSAVTLINWYATRHQRIRHAEALATGWLPVVGSVAFPLQMFATRSKLSTFIIRDTASRIGTRIPIYGGNDSRTEIALIRATDLLVEFMHCASSWIQRACGPTASGSSAGPRRILPIGSPTRFGRMIDRHAARAIATEQHGQRHEGILTQRQAA